jgi:hypothetical protein
MYQVVRNFPIRNPPRVELSVMFRNVTKLIRPAAPHSMLVTLQELKKFSVRPIYFMHSPLADLEAKVES